jgi:putative membrane protein
MGLTEAETQSYSRQLIAFSSSMKEHLRRNKLPLPFPLEESVHVGNQPLWIAHEIRKDIANLLQTNRIDNIQWQLLNKHLDSLIDSLGACERILNTPIPFSYSLFFKKFIFIYVVTMPLAFVELFEYWSVLISTFVFYALVSMEILAEEIEDPFGTDTNDLPLDDICERISESVHQVLKAK